ncbi:carboxymuconolactone decarboxylase family protein [Gelidibacter sp. F2691]|nr:carboxymuconolactone decarboxylase family protein [Gelidibacter sp. F2691]
MTTELYNADNAPDGAGELLQGIQDKMGGMLPNLYRQMAGAPVVLDAYLILSDLIAKTSFSPAEQQMILLTASARNGCKYCVAAHSSGARMAKLDKAAIEAIRSGGAIEDARLQALRSFVEEALETRGKISAAGKEAFLGAGFTETQAMEALIGVSMKALSNSFARMFETPLDDFLARMEWDGNDRV